MSIQLINWAFEQELPPLHRFLLIILADHANDDGTCWPSIKRITRRTGMSERTVQRCLRDLESTGLITHDKEDTRWVFTIKHDLPLVVSKSEITGKGSHKKLRAEAIEVFKQTCFWCQKRGEQTKGPDGKAWTLDRLRVGRDGGKYIPANVVLSCALCNSRRRTKKVEVFAAEIGKDLTDMPLWTGVSPSHRGGVTESPGGVSPSHPNHKRNVREPEDAIASFVAIYSKNPINTGDVILNEPRKAAIRARMREPKFRDSLKLLLEKVNASLFCQGGNERGWKANLDWFLRPDTYAKILEGRYDNRVTKTTKAALTNDDYEKDEKANQAARATFGERLRSGVS